MSLLPARTRSSSRSGVSSSERNAGRRFRERGTALAAAAALWAAGLAPALATEAGVRPSDAWITAKTKIALLAGREAPALGVDVDTSDGVVTLHGDVRSATERARAEKIARRVQGVRDVRNLLQVSGVAPAAKDREARREEREILHDVNLALRTDSVLEGSSVEATRYADGVVELTGWAPSVGMELHAVEIADGVPGVDGALSRIVTPGPTGSEAPHPPARAARKDAGGTRGPDAIDDAWITAEAKLRMMADERVPGASINVDTVSGKVTLFGTVRSEEARQAAEEIVREQEGVVAVRNMLQVVPGRSRERVEARDAELEQEVRKALAARPELEDGRVDFQVENGVVRLTGSVSSHADRMTAVRVARVVPGVRSVTSELQVDDRAR